MVRVTTLRLEPRPKDGVLTAWTTVTAYRLGRLHDLGGGLGERLRALKLPPRRMAPTAAWVGLGIFLFAFFLTLTFPTTRSGRGSPRRQTPPGSGSASTGWAGLPRGERPGSGSASVRGLGPPAQTVGSIASPSGHRCSPGGGLLGHALRRRCRRRHRDRRCTKVPGALRPPLLGKAGVGTLTGVDAVGTVDGELARRSHQRSAGRPAGSSQASGRVRLTGTGLEVRGTVTIPLMGQPTRWTFPAELRAARCRHPDRQGGRHDQGAPLEGRTSTSRAPARCGSPGHRLRRARCHASHPADAGLPPADGDDRRGLHPAPGGSDGLGLPEREAHGISRKADPAPRPLSRPPFAPPR